MAFAENDPEGQTRAKAFQQKLQELGLTADRNVRIEYRWVNDPDRRRSFAAELISPQCGLLFKERAAKIRAGAQISCLGCKNEIAFDMSSEHESVRKALVAARRWRIVANK
jgi:hypothetical protein